MAVENTSGASTGSSLRSDAERSFETSSMRSTASDLGDSARDAASKVTDTAQRVAQRAKEGVSDTASSLAADARTRVKSLIGEKVASGAELIGHVAESTRRAADNLDPNAPQLSGILRDAGARLEEFSQTVRHKSVDELVETATQYARRQPALLFGAAAVAGFALVRLFKAGSANGSAREAYEPVSHVDAPSIMPHPQS